MKPKKITAALTVMLMIFALFSGTSTVNAEAVQDAKDIKPLNSEYENHIDVNEIAPAAQRAGVPIGPKSASYTFTFVRKDGTEQTVEFTDLNANIGLNGTPAKIPFIIFKSYFIGWSENNNYKEDGKGHLFYNTNTVQSIVDAGLPSGTKLYALYADAFSLTPLMKNNKISINDKITATQFVLQGNPQKSGDKTEAVYGREYQDYIINTLHADFSMNPFLQSAIYKDPWVGALDNGSDWSAVNNKKGRFTAVDLHVHLDKRITLPDEFEVSFTSYTFRPVSIYSAVKADGSPVGDMEVYPYLGVDQAGDQPGEGVSNRIQENNPTTVFKTKSYLLNGNGEKVRIYDYVIRTRIRGGYDKYSTKISPLTMAQIQSDMKLYLHNSQFKVPNSVAEEIADGKAKPIKINGAIDGLVKGIYFGPINSEDELLTFYKTQNVTFINENTEYAKVKVKKGQTINTTDLTNVSMPHNPTKDGYTFKEWNAQNDGKGTAFTGATVVNEDMTVYAIYSKNAAAAYKAFPQTSDSYDLSLYGTLMGLSMLLIAVEMVKRRKKS